MQELIAQLGKRRSIIMYVVMIFGIMAIIVSYNFEILPSTYFGGKYNFYIIYFLILYKIVELAVLYYILMHRHLVFLRKEVNNTERFEKLKKHSKLLFFLIVQGNTVFGIIAFKLSGNVFYFLIFSSIAFITLFLIKPKNMTINT